LKSSHGDNARGALHIEGLNILGNRAAVYSYIARKAVAA
jgi:hypothetical protein